MNEFMTNYQIMKVLPGCRIYTARTLPHLIEDAFGWNNYFIFLFEERKNTGHWTCCIRHKAGDIEYFDSYGGIAEGYRNYFPYSYKYRNLMNLLKSYHVRTGNNIDYSGYDLQQKSSNVSTCGYHVCFRIIDGHIHIPVDKYDRWLLSLGDPDVIVYENIKKILNST